MKNRKRNPALIFITVGIALTLALTAAGPREAQTDNPDATSGATTPSGASPKSPAESAGDICASGRQYLQQKNYRAALIRFERAIRIEPEFAMAYYMRGRVRLKTDMPALALKDFTRAIELKPRDTRLLAGALYSRGALRVDMKEYAGAIEDLTEAMALLPRQALIYKKRADAYSESNMTQKALEDYKKAIALNPKYGPLLKDTLKALKQSNQSRP